MRAVGLSLDQLFVFAKSMKEPGIYDSPFRDSYINWQRGTMQPPEEDMEKLIVLKILFTKVETEKNGSIKAEFMGIYADGELWGKHHGAVNKIEAEGIPGFLGNFGANTRNGYEYSFLEKREGRIGWIIQEYAQETGSVYVGAQTAVWGIEQGMSVDECVAAAKQLYESSVDSEKIADTVKLVYSQSQGKMTGYHVLQRQEKSQLIYLPECSLEEAF